MMPDMDKGTLVIDDISHYETEKLMETDQAGHLLRRHQGEVRRSRSWASREAAAQLRLRRALCRLSGRDQLLPRDRPDGQQQGLELHEGALAGESRTLGNLRLGITVNVNAMKRIRSTRKEIRPCYCDIHHKRSTERTALTINPAKTCQPIGAMYAALGIHGCLPHSHGSQGCCAYHRSTLTRHYKEPVMAATSSFTEGASVFGGQANLLQAIDNIFTVYDPDVIAVHTTCLSETIGDDLPQIFDKAIKERQDPGRQDVIHANTPSYVGSHVTGFSNMVKAHGRYFAEPSGKKNGKINIIPGWVEPSDMGEIKRLAAMIGRRDQSCSPTPPACLNGPLTGEYKMFPEGRDHRSPSSKTAATAIGTLALGEWCSARCGTAPRHQVQGALLGAGPALRPAGHRPLRRCPADRRRHHGARRDHRSSAASWWT